ncbi:MAG: hypothetical protein JJU00_14795 [Opitutales bacterium]|nr:hypothetical protein [Opitutales bacterium]
MPADLDPGLRSALGVGPPLAADSAPTHRNPPPPPDRPPLRCRCKRAPSHG